MFKIYCRIYQKVLYIACFFLNWRKPILLDGPGSLAELPSLIKEKGIDNVIIVTDKGLMNLGLVDSLISGLASNGIKCSVFDKTVANPTDVIVEEALNQYYECKASGIIAFGGGSPMDTAKALGARVARPNKTLMQLSGLLKIRKKIPTIFAVPTTAGTGSETTLASVITDAKTHYKYAINDNSLIPPYAVLDPLLTLKLPAHITSTTGMDALTHAVEAYIGKSNTKETKENALKAIKLIYENILVAYKDGDNVEARNNMLHASYYAGIAFTRAYVGYVHSMAHAIGGLYNVPHGLANAVILPHVLEAYGKSCHKKLAELADLVGISDKNDQTDIKAMKFIDSIYYLNKSMNIPDHIEGIKEEDLDKLVSRAYKEGNPLYPVPRIFSKKEFEDLFRIIGKIKGE